jgi:hypothetical protein
MLFTKRCAISATIHTDVPLWKEEEEDQGVVRAGEDIQALKTQ